MAHWRYAPFLSQSSNVSDNQDLDLKGFRSNRLTDEELGRAGNGGAEVTLPLNTKGKVKLVLRCNVLRKGVWVMTYDPDLVLFETLSTTLRERMIPTSCSVEPF